MQTSERIFNKLLKLALIAGLVIMGWQLWKPLWARLLLQTLSRPFTVYGRIIDESNTPITGLIVTGAWTHVKDFIRVARTDESGEFELRGGSELVGVNLSTAGHYFSPNVVYRTNSGSLAQPLSITAFQFALPHHVRRFKYFGRLTDGGAISLQTEGQAPASLGHRFAAELVTDTTIDPARRRIRLTLEGGGFVPRPRHELGRAPLGPYEPDYLTSLPGVAPASEYADSGSFYFFLKDQKTYGWAQLSIDPSGHEFQVLVIGALNISGSPDLRTP